MAPHFPIVTQKDLKESRGDKSCSICCDDYAHGHIPVRTPCNHIFGQKCLAAWLADNDTCPMCRTNIVSDGLSELPSRHQSSRLGTETSRASERSSRPQFSRVETLRNERSARPRAGTEASRTAGAPSRLSVSSSQWDETHLPTGSAHRSSHDSRTAREAPTSSSHRSSHTSRTAREEPSTRSSHRSGHTSHTTREAPPSGSSYRSSHTSHTAREEPSTRSSHRSSHTSHTTRDAPSSRSSHHRSSHTSRAEPSPLATLASLLRDSINYDQWDDNRTNINTRPHAYPPFTRERLLEIVSDNYIARSNQDEIAFISDQLEQSDAREARGEDPFEPSEEYLSRESRYGHEIRIGRAASGRSGRELSSRHTTGSSSRSGLGDRSGRESSSRHTTGSSSRFGHDDRSSSRHTGSSSRSAQSAASRRTTISNMSDDDLEDAIRRLRL